MFRSKNNGAYRYGVEVVNASTSFKNLGREKEKLSAVLSNPAVMKVFSLQCDLFSMGEVTVQDKAGKEIEGDPFVNLIRNPQPFKFSNQSQFLWDYMFWNMMGTAYCYVDSSLVDRKPRNSMYFLNPANIEWPKEFTSMKDKMVFSEQEIAKLNKVNITYRYEDRSSFSFPFERLVISFDLTNGIGNLFKGPSRLDALYKIISNSEHTLDSNNINIRYSGKYLVGSDMQGGTVSKPGMDEGEKQDIVDKMDTQGKNVFPVRNLTQIRRFVENLANLQLDEKYLAQYFLIGNMYNIPRDVLEAYNSATYENQEKARAAHVNYTLDPKGNQFMNMFENHFDYPKSGRNIIISWDHLPFMQVFEKEKVDNKKTTVEVLTSLLTLGVDIKQANEFLGTEFKIKKPENVQPVSGERAQAQSQNQEVASGETSATGG